MRFTASTHSPVQVYYCKAGIQEGKTVRVLQGSGPAVSCAGVVIDGAAGEMVHDNSRGRAKRSGARCVLTLTKGTIQTVGGVR